MVAVRIELTMASDVTSATAQAKYIRTEDGKDCMTLLESLLHAVQGGAEDASLLAQVVGVKASGTIGCDYSDAVDGTDTVTIGPTTLSVEASPSGEDEFDSGATDIAFAANLVTAINAHSVLKNLVTATTDGVDTVTVTSRIAGIIGNEIILAEVGNGFTLSAAALASGTDGQDAVEFGDHGVSV